MQSPDEARAETSQECLFEAAWLCAGSKERIVELVGCRVWSNYRLPRKLLRSN
jgi:hypothetical protein